MADETSRLQAELDDARLRLAEAHKMASLGRLAAGIVHEINTPIGSIFSNNQVIDKSLEKMKSLLGASITQGQPAPQKSLDILDVVNGLVAIDKLACERISSVVRSLKTFARVNEGDLRKVDIHDVLRDMLKLSGCVFRRRIAVVTDFSELPEIECYPALLSQVFLNLVVNASQAIEEEGTVTVKTRLESDARLGEAALISVSDTGHGIRPEDQPKIFKAGFSTKPIGIGTGLGLSITREIVEDTHGGDISFTSEVGHGTTFSVRLPLTQPKASADSH